MELPESLKQPVRYGLFTPSRIFLMAILGWLFALAWPILPANNLILGMAIGGLSLAYRLRRHTLRGTSILLLSVFIAASWYHNWYLAQINPMIKYHKEQTISLTIIEEPQKYDRYQRYLARTQEGWRSYLLLPREGVIEPGTMLTVTGQYEPVGIDDHLYRLSLAKSHIFAVIPFPKIIAKQPALLTWFENMIIHSRQQFDRTVHRLLLDPQAGLLAGIIAGVKTDLPKSILDNFKIAGLSHLIAVSGFNVGIVIALFASLTKGSGRYFHLFTSVALVMFFVIFTGASASVIRAGTLALLFVFARFIGRRASLFRLLVSTSLLMTLHNPLIVRYDIGFQLSFAAVLGLIFLAEPLEHRLVARRFPKGLAQVLSATSAATLTTWPIIAHNFGTISVYALPANLIAEPLVPILTIAGLLLVALGSLLPALASWLILPIDLGLRYLISLTTTISHLPYANLTMGAVPSFLWLIYYTGLGVVFWLLTQPRKL